MKIILLTILFVFLYSCSSIYKTKSFITKYDYNIKNEYGWINTKLNSTELGYLNNGDTSVIKLIQVKNDYSEILFNNFFIKKENLIKRIDSTFSDTTSCSIRYTNYLKDDSTKYIFFTMQSKIKKHEIIDYKKIQFRIPQTRRCIE